MEYGSTPCRTERKFRCHSVAPGLRRINFSSESGRTHAIGSGEKVSKHRRRKRNPEVRIRNAESPLVSALESIHDIRADHENDRRGPNSGLANDHLLTCRDFERTIKSKWKAARRTACRFQRDRS